MATINTSSTTVEAIVLIDLLVEKVDGQVLLSQNRCVDDLLDLYNIAEPWPLRRMIEETLSDIRHVGSVEGSWMRHRLLAMAGAVEVELAFTAETEFSL